MKKIFINTVFLILFTVFAQAQDIIIKTDKTELKAKVIEVLDSAIKYKKFDFLDGPSYTISKTEVFMIIYQNGQKELFDNNPVVEQKNIPVVPAEKNIEKEIEAPIAPVEKKVAVSDYNNNSAVIETPIAGGVRNYKTKDAKKPSVSKIKRNKKSNDSGSEFGFLAGYQIATEYGDEIVATGPRNGFYFGVSLKSHFSKSLALKTDLIYSNMGATFGTVKDKLNYIQLPINLNIKLAKIVNIYVGPQIGYLLSADFNDEDYSDKLNSFDYGLTGGLGIQIPKTKLIVGISTYYGMSNIVENDAISITNFAYSANLNYFF